jgi:hypothetical protein
MERNASDNMNSTGAGVDGGTSGFGTTGGSTSGFGQEQGGSAGGISGGMSGGISGGMSGGASGGTAGVTDRLQQGREAVTDKLSQVRDKAGNLKSTLADKLEAGANSLRERGQSGQLAGAMGGATAGVSDERMQQLSGTAANALQKSATFLREGDLQASIEEQVRTNPGRTLLVALGVGYMLGKALRR